MKSEGERFGFDGGEAWMDHLRRSLAPDELGSLGPYELTGEVRRGGQGVVYRARQPGTGRDIAIKRLVAGVFATEGARRRFEREVAAASTLRHPGLVTVHGLEEIDGCPVLAMEWVDGVPVTEWAIDEGGARRPARELLRVFLRICDAVAHAHANGVLHRDLKPSNVLVDRDGRPRVLDFGLAKTADGDGDVTQWTGSAGFLGTPAYASPEQIDGGGGPLDVRSDVYSLGVVLYEMLTGARPYAPEEGMREYLDALDREAFVRPSARGRGVGPEVDAIVRRALAGRREDRYASVDALREDVRRLLAGAPVLAHDGGRLYELGKLARRHRTLAAVLGLLVVVVLAFGVVTAHQAARLAEERDLVTAEARRLASVLDFLEIDLLHAGEPAPALPGPTAATLRADVTLAELLAAAEPRIGERLGDSPPLEARVRYTVGKAYSQLGRFREAAAQLERVLEISEDDPEVGDLARGHLLFTYGNTLVKLSRIDDAAPVLERALAFYRGAGAPGDLSRSRCLRALADCALQSGRLDDMRAFLEEGLELVRRRFPDRFLEHFQYRRNLAWLDARQGRYDAARAQYEALLADCERELGGENEHVAYLLGHLSDLDEVTGDVDRARERSRRSLELTEQLYGADHPWVAGALGDLASLLEDDAEAERMLRRAIAISDRARGADAVPSLVHRVRLADVLARTDRAEEALDVYDGALPRFEEETGEDGVWTIRCRTGRGHALRALGRWDEAVAAFEHVVRLSESGEGFAPPVRARYLACLEEALRGAGRDEEADEVLGRRERLGAEAE